MKAQLTLLFVLIFAVSAQSQSDSTQTHIPPTKYQLDFIFSNGLLQKSQFEASYGSESLFPTTNRYWKGQVAVTRELGSNLKFGTGVHFGYYGFEMHSNLKKSDFPFLPETYEDNGQYVFFSYPYNYSYIGFPIRLSYNLLKQEKHQLWLEAGVGLYYQSKIDWKMGYSVSYDSNSTIDLFSLGYTINPKNEIRSHLELGLQYRYQLKNYHELIFGVSASYNPDPIFSGNYTLFPNTSGNQGEGNFSHYLNYVGLDVGYSLNARKFAHKNELFKNQKDKKRRVIPNSMSDKNEIRIGFNLKNLSYFPIKQESGIIKPEQRANDNLLFSPDALFVHYFQKNRAWYTGASFQAIGNNIFIDLTRYDPQISSSLEHSFYFGDERIGVPIGLLQEIELNAKSNLEFREEFQFLIGFYNTADGSYLQGYAHDSLGTESVVYSVSFRDYNWVVPIVNLNAAYVYNNKNQNKWIIGAKLSYSLISNYKMDYSLLQSDGSYESGTISNRPFSVSLYMQHALTFKKRRYLMENY